MQQILKTWQITAIYDWELMRKAEFLMLLYSNLIDEVNKLEVEDYYGRVHWR